MTELAKVKRTYVTTEYFCVAIEFGRGWDFYVATELVKVKRIYDMTEYFCVAIEFDLRWGFYVAIEYSYFATDFGLDMRF